MSEVQTYTLLRRVLVVGGELADNTFIRTNLAKKLYTVGLVVTWIWASDNMSNQPIPEGCDLVLLLTDWIGHAATNRIVAQAQKQNIKFVRGVRQWAKLQSILVEQKVISLQDLVAARSKQEISDKEPPTSPEKVELPPPEPLPQVSASWMAAGKSLDDLLRVFRNVVAELITGHHIVNIKVSDSGRITMDVRKEIDLNELFKEKE